ncbi:2-deoxyribose-5-phosphate aldolase [Prochlorococcus sp. AH-716-E13]|nr:2-deoxyribose-5-phosphate aldolase [Prochlorococcus sp. AH-716-E13]
MFNIDYELNEKIHSIIINPYLSLEELDANCDLIQKFNIRNISTSLNFLSHIKNALCNHKVNINTLISYPFADLPPDFIDDFVCYAKDAGASGIEYTPNFLNLYKNNLNNFASEIESINSSELPVTIIINKTRLAKELFEKAIEISLELGITNFQFGDGFGPAISKVDIIEILKFIGNQNSIKVVGGIKTLSQVLDLLDTGVDNIGTSNFNEIFKEIRLI